MSEQICTVLSFQLMGRLINSQVRFNVLTQINSYSFRIIVVPPLKYLWLCFPGPIINKITKPSSAPTLQFTIQCHGMIRVTVLKIINSVIISIYQHVYSPLTIIFWLHTVSLYGKEIHCYGSVAKGAAQKYLSARLSVEYHQLF